MGKKTAKKQALEAQKQVKINEAFSRTFVKPIKDKNEVRKKVDSWYNRMHYNFLGYSIRDRKEFNVLSFNETALKMSLIRHMYLKYPAPEFLIRAFATLTPGSALWGLATKWFFDVTTGKSFYKENKQHFTKKEAHIFLQAVNTDIIENIIWAKCKARSIPRELTIILKQRSRTMFLSKKLELFLDFVAANSSRKITSETLQSIIDYVNIQPDSFSFKNRTWKSVVRNCERWHRDSRWNQYANPYREWEYFPKMDWTFTDELDTVWTIKELLNSTLLLEESVTLNHCVVTYKNLCVTGDCRIFTLLNTTNVKPIHVLTIEVGGKKVKQIRGNYNRLASKEEMKIINKWREKFRLN